jgi:hypothetical protein
VPLSEHNNVVKAFPSDRTDQPFGISILPRGAWRRWSVANAHRSKSSDEDIAIGPIAIADQIVGSPFPAESFRNLICNPFCGRMRCDAEPYDLSSAVPATVAFKSLSASEVLSNPFRLDVYAFDWASNRVAGRAL